ncbi:hypothetical protein GCM10027347_50980 [Larkinella harenae]
MPKHPIQSLTGQLKSANITMEHVANELKVARGTLHQRKKNPQKFTVEEIIAISSLLKKTPTAILKAILHDLDYPSSDTKTDRETDAEKKS